MKSYQMAELKRWISTFSNAAYYQISGTKQ